MFVGLVGEPGKGKDNAMVESKSAVDLGDDDETPMKPGSGEGLAHIYRERRNGKEEWIKHRVLLQESEVETLTTLGGRRGSTLLSELRNVWSAGPLGHAYVDKQKRLSVPRHGYRLALVVGVQPAKAGSLLSDEDAGMPQRFLWFICADRDAPDAIERGLKSEVIQLGYANVLDVTVDPVLMPVCKKALDEIDHFQLANLRGDLAEEAVHGHWLQSKLRVAALLAILHGCTEVDEQWWGLAEYVMKRSDEGRAMCSYYTAHA